MDSSSLPHQIEPEASNPGHVYFVTDGECIKVGFSREPKSRLGALQVGNARNLRLLATVPGTEEIESALHLKLAHLRLPDRREWFRDRDYEIIHLIESLMAAANPGGPIPLLPHTEDIAFEYSETGLFMKFETLRLGTREYRQNVLRNRIYGDLLGAKCNGGDRRARDLARNLLKAIEDGSHPLLKGADKPWPPRPTHHEREGVSR